MLLLDAGAAEVLPDLHDFAAVLGALERTRVPGCDERARGAP